MTPICELASNGAEGDGASEWQSESSREDREGGEVVEKAG